MGKAAQTFKNAQSIEGLRALVVDDSSFDREVAVATLRKIGIIDIQVAENGAIATTKLNTALLVSKPFDIVFLDSRMPAQDGFGLLKWIRGERRLKKTAVIITSGTSNQEDIKNYISLGADEIAVKPLTLAVLLEKIRGALKIEDTSNDG